MMSLWSWEFWFAQFPLRLSPLFERGFFLLFCAVALAAIIARIWARQEAVPSRVRREVFAYSSWYILLSLLGFAWLFAASQELQFFGMKIWFAVWVVAILFLSFKARYFFRVELPLQKARSEASRLAAQYRPRRK